MYSIVLRVKRVLRKFKHSKFMLPVIWLRKIAAYVDGQRFIKKLEREKKENEIFLLLYPPLGDHLYGMAMIEGVLKKYRDKTIVVFACLKNKDVMMTYPANNRLKFRFISDFELEKIYHFTYWPELSERVWSRGIIVCSTCCYRERAAHGKPTNIDCLKHNILELPDDTKITYHGFKGGKVTSIPNFSEVKHRTAIINPYSNSMRNDKHIYEVLCRTLNERGFIVFTNVSGGYEAVKGSEVLDCDLQELYSIACEIPLIVSVRSGILDFLIPSGINMFVVYDHNSGFYKGFPLSEWQGRGEIREVLVQTEAETESLPEQLSLFLDELKQEGKIS